MKHQNRERLRSEDQQTVTIAGAPDAWAELIDAKLSEPARPSKDALTFTELAKKLGTSANGARYWAERQARAGLVRIVEGRHEKMHRPTMYVVPIKQAGAR